MSGCSDATITQFDIVGSFFVNKFYNELYHRARDGMAGGKHKSLTDAFRSVIGTYLHSIEADTKLYSRTLSELVKWYADMTSGFSVTLSEFEDKILTEFIPPEYYRDFTMRDREKCLHEIICGGVAELSKVSVAGSMLKRIIDDHTNTANVEELQKKMIDTFAIMRANYHAKFVTEISKSNAAMTVPKEVFDKLRKEYATVMQRAIDAEAEARRAKSMLAMLLEKMESGKQTEASVVVTPQRARVSTPARATVKIEPESSDDEPQENYNREVEERVTPPRAQPRTVTPQAARASPKKTETPTRQRVAVSQPTVSQTQPTVSQPVVSQSTISQSTISQPPSVNVETPHALTTPMRPAGKVTLSQMRAMAAEPVVEDGLYPVIDLESAFDSAFNAEEIPSAQSEPEDDDEISSMHRAQIEMIEARGS